MTDDEITASKQLASFLADFDPSNVPSQVLDLGRSCLLNGLGVAMCGLGTAAAKVGGVAANHLDGGLPGKATVFSDGRKTSVASALLANTALLHGRVQEDTCGTAHLGVIVIPLLLALAETKSTSLQQLLNALIVGYEVGGQLEREFGVHSLGSGFRATPLYGVFAGTAAASRLLELDRDTTANALALSVSFAGFNSQTIVEGSEDGRFQPAMAALAALVATELAIAGAAGSKLAFEGKCGFAPVFAGREFGRMLFERLGSDWVLRRTMFKPYPICQHNQSVVTGALRLRDAISARQLDRIEVHVSPYLIPGMLLKGPFTSTSETLLSTSFCVGCALARGRIEVEDLAAFSDEAILHYAAMVEVVPDENVNYPGSEIIAFKGGEVVARHNERVSVTDYNYSLDKCKSQLDRLFAERHIPPNCLHQLIAFVDELPTSHIERVTSAFSEARQALKAP